MAEAESVLVAWLEQAFPDARICTETPGDLDALVLAGTDVIAVSRFGGSDDEVPTFDNASMDFDCYSSTHPLARTLGYAVRSGLRNDAPGKTVGGAFIGRVRSISGPAWTPYENTKVRRFTYSAQIRLHSLEA
jgi:hypothetical protein